MVDNSFKITRFSYQEGMVDNSLINTRFSYQEGMVDNSLSKYKIQLAWGDGSYLIK
jgi:hypothetical protein